MEDTPVLLSASMWIDHHGNPPWRRYLWTSHVFARIHRTYRIYRICLN